MTMIPLNLTLEETNTILEALGQMPYARVYMLIAKIQQQATTHLHEDQHEPEKQNQNEKRSESTGGLR
jgi:hypothetical protein